MDASRRSRLARFAATSFAAAAAWGAASSASAAPPSRAVAPASAIVLAQSVCRVGDYASHDHAISVRDNLQHRGRRAWIEHHGSLYSGTRTYVVFTFC